MSWFSCSKAIRSLVIVALVSFLTPAAASANDPIETGKKVYSQTCVACHGANGKGMIPGVSDFTKADGPLAKSDEVLIASIRDGLVTPGKPLSMPAKGGNPTLSDEEIEAVLLYLKTIFGS
jgi:mono/diheme cytochrome c family protein